MAEKFNSYINNVDINFWRDLCVKEGVLRTFFSGEEFVTAGEAGRYIGYVKSGILKYVAYSSTGHAHVIGLESAGEFVTDFPFSIYGQKSRVSIIAESDCEIYCIITSRVREMMESDPNIKDMIMAATEAVFSTVYDRYIAMYTQTSQERYINLIRRYPDLFTLFSLRDIASFLNITPTHLSRLRRHI